MIFTAQSKEAVLGEKKVTHQLFKKTLNIPLDTLELVRDLINQGSLLRGDMYLDKVLNIIQIKTEYDSLKLSTQEKDIWIWNILSAVKYPKFANELIGTLCVELAEDKELNEACLDYNKRADPANYAQAKSAVTPKMRQEAEKQIEELGFTESFDKKFATIEDIDVSQIMHSNADNTISKPVGLFAKAGVPTSTRHKRAEFDQVETVSIEKFMDTILPTATQLEVYLENKLENNLVALFTEQVKGSKLMFKWNNPFSWTYKNNLSGVSMIKENVKRAGGKVTGVLRCSLQWNDEDTKGIVDFDLHCKTPLDHIYYRNKVSSTKGQLDVDMIRPINVGIENITWQNKVPDGIYNFYVNTFCSGVNTGFKIQIEFNEETFDYHYNKPTTRGTNTQVAAVTVKNGEMSIEHHLPEISGNSSKNMWNLDSNQFHKVNLVCTSPNYWGENNIGTKEYFFMLQDCKPDTALKAFHTDHLCGELMNIRKAIGLLGNYKMVEPSSAKSNSLSGIGFNSTVRNELIVKVSGSHKRVIKIKF